MRDKIFVILLLIVCIVLAVVAFRPEPTPAGYAGLREPSVSLPPGVSVLRYYDPELDVVCWLFTKRFTGEPHYDTSSNCLPRSQTDY